MSNTKCVQCNKRKATKAELALCDKCFGMGIDEFSEHSSPYRVFRSDVKTLSTACLLVGMDYYNPISLPIEMLEEIVGAQFELLNRGVSVYKVLQVKSLK